MISVYEGDNYDNPDSPENVKLAEIPWEFKPPRTQRNAGLEVLFEYGDDGILTVQIADPHGNQKKRFSIQQTGEDKLTPNQIQQIKEINKSLLEKGNQLELTAEYQNANDVLKKAEQDVMPKLDNLEDRRKLEELCRAVRQAINSGDPKKIEEASGYLGDQLLNYAWLL